MTKTRRQMAEYIKQVDAVCEVVDARIPQVSRNPDMDEIAAGKPRLMILNRIDLADPKMTAAWAKHFRAQGMAVIETDSRAGTGTQAFSNAVRTLLADKIAQWNEKGLVGKAVLRKEGFYNDQPIVKRIIATGGDTIDIDPVTGDVLVNGEVLDEPYIAEKINTLEKMGDMTYPQTVPEGCVFVMGDNRNYSTDSRWSQLGMVDERYILGHVLSVVYPFSEFGSVA